MSYESLHIIYLESRNLQILYELFQSKFLKAAIKMETSPKHFLGFRMRAVLIQDGRHLTMNYCYQLESRKFLLSARNHTRQGPLMYILDSDNGNFVLIYACVPQNNLYIELEKKISIKSGGDNGNVSWRMLGMALLLESVFCWTTPLASSRAVLCQTSVTVIIHALLDNNTKLYELSNNTMALMCLLDNLAWSLATH